MSEQTRETHNGINFGPFLWVVIFTLVVAFFYGLYRYQQVKLYEGKQQRYYSKMMDGFK